MVRHVVFFGRYRIWVGSQKELESPFEHSFPLRADGLKQHLTNLMTSDTHHWMAWKQNPNESQSF